MILVRSPFRISFAGGGTDIPYFYEKFGGCVISTSIDKYVYLSMHNLFYKDAYLLKYSKCENVDSVDKIQHNFIREIFKQYNIKGVDFNSAADIPSGTGLSSSSAFSAALIHLCSIYNNNQYLSKSEIAELAFELEQKYSPSIGKQDQYATAFGGINYIEFEPNGQVKVEPLYIQKDELKRLQNNLMLFYTNISHDSSQILTQQQKEVVNNVDKERNLCQLKDLTHQLKSALLKNDIDYIGTSLAKGWELKRQLNKSMTNKKIDDIYNTAIDAGADGGKLLGAGGGGFLLFYVKEQYHSSVRKSLSEYQELPFNFETGGTSVIYYN